MRIDRPLLLLTLIAVAAPPAAAQAGTYSAELIGPGVVVNDMNESGQVVGWTVATGVVRAFLAGPGGQHELLPHPSGYASAWAQGINDAGVVVGSTATGGYPEFGEACSWTPDGSGGWTIQLLGQLPGHFQSVAYDVNNRGDIVGVSVLPGWQGGPTVWFNSPSGVLDIGALGAPSSPKQINDEGVVVGINGGLFDVDTLTATPLPALPAGWTGFQGWAISEQGGLAGTAFHGGVARSAAIWTPADGWLSISPQYSLSASVQAFDINDAGLAQAEIPTPAVRLVGAAAAQPLSTLLLPAQQGQWSFVLSLGGAVSDNGRIAAIGTHGPTGASGVVLLTPSACTDAHPTYCFCDGTGAPAPCGNAGAADAGCANGTFAAGCVLSAVGCSSVGLDALTLLAARATPGQPGLFFQGDAALGGGAGLAFGDGLRCAGDEVVRLETVFADPNGGAASSVALAAAGGVAAGDTKRYQLWYRDPALSPCGAGFNLSNGVEVTWSP